MTKRIPNYLFVSYYLYLLIDGGFLLLPQVSGQGVKGGSFSKTSSFSKSSGALSPSIVTRLQTNKFQQQQQQSSQVSSQPQQFVDTQIERVTQNEQSTVGVLPPAPVIETTQTFTKVEKSSSSSNSIGQQTDSEPTVYGVVDGVPGVDFPGYTTIPNTKFSCEGRQYEIGMYADEDTGCQVYHLCYRGRRESFLCGIGTVFNQAILACDYWHSVKCSDSSQHYGVNAGLGVSSSEPGTGSISTNSIVSKVIQESRKLLRPVAPPPQQLIQQNQQTSSSSFRQIQPINPLTIVNQQAIQTEQFSSQQQPQPQPVLVGKTSFRQERRESSGLLSPSQQAQAALKFQSERSVSSGSSPTVVIVRSVPGLGTGATRKSWRVSSAVNFSGDDNAASLNEAAIASETDAVQGAASELFTRSSAQSSAANTDSTNQSSVNSNRLQSLLKQQREQKTIVNSIGPKLPLNIDDEWKPVTRSSSNKPQTNSQRSQSKKSSDQVDVKPAFGYSESTSNDKGASNNNLSNSSDTAEQKVDSNTATQLTTTSSTTTTTQPTPIVDSTTPTPTPTTITTTAPTTTSTATTISTEQPTESIVTKLLETTVRTTKLPDLTMVPTVPDNEAIDKHEAASESQEVTVSKLPTSGTATSQFIVAAEKPSTSKQHQDYSQSDNTGKLTQGPNRIFINNGSELGQQKSISTNEPPITAENQSQQPTITASSDATASSLSGLAIGETTTATTISTNRLSQDSDTNQRVDDTNRQLLPPTTSSVTAIQMTTNNVANSTTADATATNASNNNNTKDNNNQTKNTQ